jgi:hypothetical protein
MNITHTSLQKMLAGPQITLCSEQAEDGKLVAEFPDSDANIFSIYMGARTFITATVAELDPGVPPSKFDGGTEPFAYLITKPRTVIAGRPDCHLIKLFYFSPGHPFFDHIKPGDVLYIVFAPDGSLISVSPAKLFP